MTETRWCKRCVVSNHRPIASREYARTPGSEPGMMAFDSEGVCGACRVAERKDKANWADREDALKELLARYRRNDGRPDVLIPSSGGKDSVYASHLLKYKYGMSPLTVTWRPNGYTDVGWRNFNAWLESGFDNYLVTPNPKVHRLLTRLAFVNMLHPFQAFILGQRSLAPKIAAAHGIELVFFGEDDEEFEGEKGWQEKPETIYQSADVRALHIGGVPYEQLIKDYGLTKHDLWIYLPPGPVNVEQHALGKFIRWQPQAAYYFAVEHGFEANAERTEGTYSRYNSVDDRCDPIHYFAMHAKWGIGRATHDASQEIRNGHLTREEGVALVHQYDGEIRPATVRWACDYMGITEDDFWTTVGKFKREYPQVS